MKTYESKLLWKKILKLAGIATGVYVGVRFFLPLVIPFFVAFALAALLHGAAAKIEKKAGKGKRALRLFLFFFFFLLVVGRYRPSCFFIKFQSPDHTLYIVLMDRLR